MSDVIQTGQMVFRGDRHRPRAGPTLTQQRQGMAMQQRPPQQAFWSNWQPEPAGDDYWTRSAEEAKAAGKSKAQWLNEMYGTDFFMDSGAGWGDWGGSTAGGVTGGRR